MNIIRADRRPEKRSDVKQALFDAEVYRMSVTNALGCGQQKGYQRTYRGVMSEVNLLKKLRVEIAINEEFLDATIDAIIRGAKTDSIGDGKIFVTELLDSIRIRTGERGVDAIG